MAKKNEGVVADSESQAWTGGGLIKVTVVAKQPIRRRAGLEFSKEPREVEVTQAQLMMIRGDPLLAVTEPATFAAPAD